MMYRGLSHRTVSLVNTARRSISSETLENFPYKFGNTSELLHTRKETKAESLDSMNELLNLDKYKLKEGFSMAYLALLKSIKEDSIADIGSFCERTLYRDIQEGLTEVNREAQRIELLNEDKFPNNV